MKFLDRIDRASGIATGSAMIIGAVWLAFLMVLITLDVAFRASGAGGLTGTHEIARNSVVGITFLFVPYTMRRGGHLRSEVVVKRLPGGLQRSARAVGSIGGALVFVAILWASWGPAFRDLRVGAYTGEGALRVPVAPFRFIIIVASILMVVECLLDAFRHFRHEVRDGEGAAADPELAAVLPSEEKGGRHV